MGEGPTLIKVTAEKALYIGGISVLPNRIVLLFDASYRGVNSKKKPRTKWSEYFPNDLIRFESKE
jgi:hypothetical protein